MVSLPARLVRRYGHRVLFATWNVNSVRSRTDQLLSWLVDRQIDVALIQETKCTDKDFPFGALAAAGYESAHHGMNHWNGVAIISRVGLANVVRGFESAGPDASDFDEPRLVAADCGGVRCWSVYVPNGRAVDDPHFAYKLRWLDQLRVELDTAGAADKMSLVAGDFNVGVADLDFYDAKRWKNKKHATAEERAALAGVLDVGLADLARRMHPDDPMFTWWNYVGTQFYKDKGLRIDLALASARLAATVESIWVDRPARDPELVAPAKPSDHAPLVIEINL